MAPSAYSSRSLLPWQAATIPQFVTSEQYTLCLTDAHGAALCYLSLARVRSSGRWVIALHEPKNLDKVFGGREGGYRYARKAERELMLALARFLHPE